MVAAGPGGARRINGPRTPDEISRYNETEPSPSGARGRERGDARQRTGAPAPASGATDRAAAKRAKTRRAARQRAAAAAAGLHHRAQHRHPGRQARLCSDRRNAVAVRSIRRSLGRDLLHRLRREERRARQPARHLRLQRRPGRGVGFSDARTGRAADRRIRRQRSGRDEAAGQSADLARLYRPGDDRSGRNRLEPARQDRRRQRVLRRAQRRPGARQGGRALPVEERPRRTRRNICWARATAASAPPSWRRRCNATRASRSTAS